MHFAVHKYGYDAVSRFQLLAIVTCCIALAWQDSSLQHLRRYVQQLLMLAGSRPQLVIMPCSRLAF
jgi:hypothetical protein